MYNTNKNKTQYRSVKAYYKFISYKFIQLTAKKRDQRDYKNSDKNRLVKIKVKLEAN